MARPLRVEFEGAVDHLCARGNARQPVFRDERDCARFLELLTESAQRFEAAILCFVLMGNHFHLVAQTRRPNLQRWMYAAVAQRIPRTRSIHDTAAARKLIGTVLNV